MELQMGELSGEELTALMTQYDQLSEDFRRKGGFTYEADIRAILNGFKFDQSMRADGRFLSWAGRIPAWPLAACWSSHER